MTATLNQDYATFFNAEGYTGVRLYLTKGDTVGGELAEHLIKKGVATAEASPLVDKLAAGEQSPEVPYGSMTVKQLREEAKKRGFDNLYDLGELTKKDLVEMFTSASK